MQIDPKYEFFLADLCFLFIWLVLYVLRPDLKRKFIKFSIYCGIMGLVTEYWFFEDYWQPLTVFGKKVISFEDFLCGFTIGGMSFTLYDVVFRKKDVHYLPKKRKEFKYLFLIFILFMLFLINICGFNTIIINSLALLGFAAYMVIQRNDLLLPTIFSGVLLTVLMLVVYHIVFNIFFPDFWKRSWLFENTSHGIYIYKNIPLSEIIWYFSWGCFAGVAHNYSSGQKKISINVQ